MRRRRPRQCDDRRGALAEGIVEARSGPPPGEATGPARSWGDCADIALTPRRLALNILAAHFVHRGGEKRFRHGYGRLMSPQISKRPASVADEFDARAATFRRVAVDLNDPDERDELLRIADGYEQDAARLREASGSAGS